MRVFLEKYPCFSLPNVTVDHVLAASSSSGWNLFIDVKDAQGHALRTPSQGTAKMHFIIQIP